MSVFSPSVGVRYMPSDRHVVSPASLFQRSDSFDEATSDVDAPCHQRDHSNKDRRETIRRAIAFVRHQLPSREVTSHHNTREDMGADNRRLGVSDSCPPISKRAFPRSDAPLFLQTARYASDDNLLGKDRTSFHHGLLPDAACDMKDRPLRRFPVRSSSAQSLQTGVGAFGKRARPHTSDGGNESPQRTVFKKSLASDVSQASSSLTCSPDTASSASSTMHSSLSTSATTLIGSTARQGDTKECPESKNLGLGITTVPCGLAPVRHEHCGYSINLWRDGTWGEAPHSKIVLARDVPLVSSGCLLTDAAALDGDHTLVTCLEKDRTARAQQLGKVDGWHEEPVGLTPPPSTKRPSVESKLNGHVAGRPTRRRSSCIEEDDASRLQTSKHQTSRLPAPAPSTEHSSVRPLATRDRAAEDEPLTLEHRKSRSAGQFCNGSLLERMESSSEARRSRKADRSGHTSSFTLRSISPALPNGAREHAAIEGGEFPPVRQLELAALLCNVSLIPERRDRPTNCANAPFCQKYNLLIDEAADLITKAATRSINSETPRDPPFAHKATKSRAPKDLGSLFKQDVPVCDRHKLLKTGILHLCHTTLLPVSLQWAKGRTSPPEQRGKSPVPPVEACSLLAEPSMRPNATAATIPQQQKAVSSVRLITSLFLDIATLCCWCGLAPQPSSAAQFTTVGFGRAKAATAFLDNCLDHCQFYDSSVSFIVVANSDPTSDSDQQGASEGVSDTSAQLCRSLGLQVVNNDENNTVLESDNIEVQAVLSGGLETDRERLEELSTDAIELADAPKIIADADMLNH